MRKKITYRVLEDNVLFWLKTVLNGRREELTSDCTDDLYCFESQEAMEIHLGEQLSVEDKSDADFKYEHVGAEEVENAAYFRIVCLGHVYRVAKEEVLRYIEDRLRYVAEHGAIYDVNDLGAITYYSSHLTFLTKDIPANARKRLIGLFSNVAVEDAKEGVGQGYDIMIEISN